MSGERSKIAAHLEYPSCLLVPARDVAYPPPPPHTGFIRHLHRPMIYHGESPGPTVWFRGWAETVDKSTVRDRRPGLDLSVSPMGDTIVWCFATRDGHPEEVAK